MADYPTIIIDTREQRPWAFPEWVPVKVQALPAGDYALEGDDYFAIERKSLDDFVGTLFSGWQRFQRELARMERARFVARVIIVEADYADLMFTQDEDGELVPPSHRHGSITPQAMAARIAELALQGVTTLFCRDASHAALQAYYLLMERYTWKKLQ